MVYAEFCEFDGMGAQSRVYCYVIENDELVQYYTDIKEYEDILYDTFYESNEKLSDTSYFYSIAFNRVVPKLDHSTLFFGIFYGMKHQILFSRYISLSFTYTGYFIEINSKKFEFNSIDCDIYNFVKPKIITVYEYLVKNGLG